MKTIFKSTLVFALAAGATLTSCIDEVEPTNGVTQDQLDGSIKAGEAMIAAMPGHMVAWNSGYQEWHGDFGYSSMMHIRDLMTGDMTTNGNGLNYDQWWPYEEAYVTESSAYAQRIWNYYTVQVQTSNIAAAYYNADIESEAGKGARAIALAFRAMSYLDMARWYEFLPNSLTTAINSKGNDVTGLTVPIVTEYTTEEEARNNPRATRQEMVDFILSDLKYAEENIQYSSYAGDKLFPGLDCVYGLYSRLYMWIEDYNKAAEYAEKALNAAKQYGRSVLREDEWTNTSTGFNTLETPSWMWGLKFEKENRPVTSGICNWTSMVSAETEYGYAAVLNLPYLGPGACPVVDASMYDRIPDTDFRKFSWIAPAGTALANSTPLIEPTYIRYFATYGPYCAIKFRPGMGNTTDYTVGSSTAVPVMRIEEMWFNYIESVAHTSPAQGKTLLEQWMQTYRDENYTCSATSQDDIIEEIIFQKRVEFWGEGLTFWDIKRLNYSVTRDYPGTNFYGDAAFNSVGRPAWMNMVFVQTEGNNNAGVANWNNPDFSQYY
ncbi:MAG: RagB/SusD family nutrient uptake outer membrane protein [Duncaniella sp.]|nr:RagB/SusD family nutrient uptake outer membrane protein [Duncaniella sp.]